MSINKYSVINIYILLKEIMYVFKTKSSIVQGILSKVF